MCVRIAGLAVTATSLNSADMNVHHGRAANNAHLGSRGSSNSSTLATSRNHFLHNMINHSSASRRAWVCVRHRILVKYLYSVTAQLYPTFLAHKLQVALTLAKQQQESSSEEINSFAFRSSEVLLGISGRRVLRLPLQKASDGSHFVYTVDVRGVDTVDVSGANHNEDVTESQVVRGKAAFWDWRQEDEDVCDLCCEWEQIQAVQESQATSKMVQVAQPSSSSSSRAPQHQEMTSQISRAGDFFIRGLRSYNVGLAPLKMTISAPAKVDFEVGGLLLSDVSLFIQNVSFHRSCHFYVSLRPTASSGGGGGANKNTAVGGTGTTTVITNNAGAPGSAVKGGQLLEKQVSNTATAGAVAATSSPAATVVTPNKQAVGSAPSSASKPISAEQVASTPASQGLQGPALSTSSSTGTSTAAATARTSSEQQLQHATPGRLDYVGFGGEGGEILISLKPGDVEKISLVAHFSSPGRYDLNRFAFRLSSYPVLDEADPVDSREEKTLAPVEKDIKAKDKAEQTFLFPFTKEILVLPVGGS
ncbi:unnamed protein product [Amoebophrya sp. A25]|nr:unnamed protein product [Amoebophrya sp. A25]|eukprot:GSA25T00023840001.1